MVVGNKEWFPVKKEKTIEDITQDVERLRYGMIVLLFMVLLLFLLVVLSFFE